MVNVDPLALKPELAEYANTLYRQLWFESNLKNKIMVGKHNLKCSEEARLQRFTGPGRKGLRDKYDGVHMYSLEGKVWYTDNVLSILSSSLSTEGPRLRPNCNDDHNQTSHMNSQNNVSSPSVPVQNRFEVLGN